MLHLVLNQRWD